MEGQQQQVGMVKPMQTMNSKEKVAVRILVPVMGYKPGDVVEVSPIQAQQLVQVSLVRNGEGFTEHRRAMLESEAQKLQHKSVDLRKLTQHEARQLGLKNIVVTPKDHAYESFLKRKAAEPPLDEPFREMRSSDLGAGFDPGTSGQDVMGQLSGHQFGEAMEAPPIEGAQSDDVDVDPADFGQPVVASPKDKGKGKGKTAGS